MSIKATWLSLSALIVMSLLVISFGCKTPSPTPTPAPKPAPTTTAPTATPTASPTATPTASPKPAPTTAATPYFKGKTITMIVPFAPGGGTDLLARLWAKYLSKFIPGNPNVIVNNLPGAGGLIGATAAYNSKKDGTTAMVSSGGPYLLPLFKVPEANFEFGKMTMIVSDIGGITYYAKGGIIKSADEIQKFDKWVYGCTPTGFPIWFFAVANEIMAIPTEKVLPVYTGAAAARMALFSGEVNMASEGSNAYVSVITPFVKKGDIMPLFTTGVLDASGKIVREPLLPDMPTFAELAEKVTGKPIPAGKSLEALKAIMSGFSFLHNMVVPPGVPNDVVKILWDAASQMIKDPAYIKDAEPLGGAPPTVWAGETIDKAFKSQYVMSDETAKWIMDVAWQKYKIKPAG